MLFRSLQKSFAVTWVYGRYIRLWEGVSFRFREGNKVLLHSFPQAKRPSVDNLAEPGERYIRSQAQKPNILCEGLSDAD